MTNKRALTAQEKAMAARMKAIIAGRRDLTEEAVSEIVGVSQGMVSHWTGGRNPVPARRAVKLAAALGIADPGEISLQYREVRGRRVDEDPAPSDPTPSPAMATLQRELDALRAVVAVLVTVACAHRPIEGADVAKRLRKHVSPDLVQQGFVHDLLQTLDKVADSSAPKRPAAPHQSEASSR